MTLLNQAFMHRWTSQEQPLRIGLYSTGGAVGAIVGQAFDFGAASIQGPFHGSPWKWIYVFLGSLTVAYSILFIVLFPDSPMKGRFLNERERNIAVRRVLKNHTGIQTRKFKVSQLWDALKDLQTWILAYLGFAINFAASSSGR